MSNWPNSGCYRVKILYKKDEAGVVLKKLRWWIAHISASFFKTAEKHTNIKTSYDNDQMTTK